MLDLEKFIDGLHKYLADAFGPLVARIKAVEDRQPQRGEKGEAGERGDRGEKGDRGERGEKGDAGERGADGKDGAPGRDGQDGAKGDPGENGKAGADGRDGKDGERGPQGEKGADGLVGRDGQDGAKGDPGQDGKDGVPGRDGEKGDAGTAGADGKDGRDALQIEVLDGIDAAKSYERGTFVAFRGGLVRSFRKTDQMPDGGELEKSGWHVIFNGLAEVAIEHGDDLRKIGLALRLTSGQIVMRELTVPVMIYRGVWSQDTDYQTGDVTTRDGSTWVLVGDVQRAAPGTPGVDSGWQLSVKKGRDGIKGDRGDRGAPGRDGKDST